MNFRITFLLVGLLWLTSVQVNAQGILKRDGLMKMDQGANAMMEGRYEDADQLFREALGLLDKLPSDIAYYFGRNSYHLKKYKQAINWLNKYVELKGTSGKHYDKVALYLDRANEGFRRQREQEQKFTEQQLTNDGYYDCPGEVVTCPLCQGSGVLITPGKFGAVYQTCPLSGLSGRLTCDEYNQYLRGELATQME